MDEFEFINNLKFKYGLKFVGDDAAILPKDADSDLLISSDMLAEDIDFRLDWTTPEFLGHKALAVSLSDIAAMGGTPKWTIVSIGLPENLWNTGFLERFYAGWNDLAAKHCVDLVGGDISRTTDRLIIDATALGEVRAGRAIARSGARPGDLIYVTGYLGGAAAGLKMLLSGTRFGDELPAPVKHLLFRQLQPLPQVKTAIVLQTHGLASAAIDISDGLSSDLNHILRASGVGARIYADQIPVDPAIAAVFPNDEENLEMALHGGEDLELLLTVPPTHRSAADDLGFHQIGEATEEVDKIELIRDSIATVLHPGGFRHF